MRRPDMRFTSPASFECCFISSRYRAGITWLKMSIFTFASSFAPGRARLLRRAPRATL
jgi:hypothetical protein